MGIFNKIFDPIGKNWDDQINNRHFKMSVWVKYAYTKMMYTIWIGSLVFITNTPICEQKIQIVPRTQALPRSYVYL